MISLQTELLFDLPLADIWFALVFFILGMFLFLDGFDFGVGVLFATRRDEHERETLLAAIGPFWDGNEVWLVVFGGALFAAFPAVYANLFSRHYLLLFAILGALILRGVSPEFYEQRESERWHRVFGTAFVVGSVSAPFFLGVFTGNWLLGTTRTITLPGVVVGLLVVALSVVEGVGFLGLKTRGDLRREMRRYGEFGAGAYLLLVVAMLAYLWITGSRTDALASPVALAFVVLTVALLGTFVVATRAERYLLAFVAAGGLSFALVGLVARLLYPEVDPAVGLTIREAVVGPVALNLMTIVAAILVPLVLGYFGVLYRVFSGPVSAEESY